MRIASLVALVIVACSSSSKPPADPASQPVTGGGEGGGGGERAVLYPGGEPRFEGPTFKNACAGDGECKVGGCGGEVCTAEEGVNSVCVAYPDAPKDASCGCVKGECVWYRAAGGGGGGGGGGGSAAGGAGQGEPCPDGKCVAGTTCVKYLGIAGARGPTFTSCEIPCGLKGGACPEGQQCITIADGPGQVCRSR
jgi:eight-cysteine-cluster-containing protein